MDARWRDGWAQSACAGERAVVCEFVHRVSLHRSSRLFDVKTKEGCMSFFNLSEQPSCVESRWVDFGGVY